MAQIDMSSGSASAYGAGELQLQNKAPMDGTLRIVTDSANTASPLKLSTALVQSTSTVKITTSDVAYIDAEDNSGNNRFTVSRASASQLVTVDFASVPTALTTPVGAIRTATDGVNLANVMTFLENGKIGMGTDTPSCKLEIDDAGSGGVAIFRVLRNAGADGGAVFSFGSATLTMDSLVSDIVLSIQGSEKMRITTAGNVGIGTTSPTAKLDVTSTGTASYSASALPTATISTPTTGTINAAYTSIHLGARGQFGQGQAVAITNVPTADGDSAMAFTTQNSYAYSEKMRITSAGNVGIGTSTPTQQLEVSSTTGGVLRLKRDDANVTLDEPIGTVEFFTNDADGAHINSYIKGLGADLFGNFGRYGTLAFGVSLTANTDAVEVARFTEGGYLRLTGATSGIQFNGDTAAANALDDYEEGTWTMGISFGGGSVGVTTSLSTGTYTKIGRQVSVNGILSLTNKGISTGDAIISGLPFTIGGGASNYPVVNFRFNALTFINQFQGYGAVNNTIIVLEEITSLGVVTPLTNADFSNNTDIIVSMTYFV